MNEAETRAELIDPALKAAGWGEIVGSRVRREVIASGWRQAQQGEDCGLCAGLPQPQAGSDRSEEARYAGG